MQIWEAPEDVKQLVKEVKEAHHVHLTQAGIWCLVNDSSPIVDNQLVPTMSSLCTKTEKLRTGNDFKIIFVAEAWAVLTNEQRKLAVDEALCRCGVQYVPMVQKVNKKDVVIKDEIGRTIYTTEIATDGAGVPKWKMNRPDCGAYYALLQRYGNYSESVENVHLALAGKPLKGPIAAAQADADDGLDDIVDDDQTTDGDDDTETESPISEAPAEGTMADSAAIPSDPVEAITPSQSD